MSRIDKYQSREIRRQIRRVLLEKWDPIGVSHVKEAQDEYDGYLGGIYQLLISRSDDEEFKDHFCGILEHIGLPCKDRSTLIPIIQELKKIDVSTKETG